ncbi:molybdenum cofactor biosynthesis protein MoaE [Desulfoglaeba alkanexedens]|nr:molybdenum cofactor biosynthesis protein MoaE [Desulfoglaeba alkanexedens]
MPIEEKTDMPTLCELVDKVKRSVDPAKVGMLACHNGIVRGTSRAGDPAEYLEIDCDRDAWNRVLEEVRTRPGIAAVEAFLNTGRREIGQDVLLVVVAGDIRENVFPVLEETVNRLKREAVLKREKLAGDGRR